LISIDIVRSVSQLLADKVEQEDIKGACNRIPFILKYYLSRYHKIDIDIHYGMIEHNNMYAFHMWNSYEGKEIDVTVHNQLVERVNSNSIVLDEIYIQKDGEILYHLENELPQSYLDKITEAADEEQRVMHILSKSETEKQYLLELSELLNGDGVLIAMKRRGLTDVRKIKNYLKNNFKTDMNETFKYLKNIGLDQSER